MGRGFYTPALLAITVVLAGCAANRGSIDSYTDPSFTPGGITNIAVFPIQNARLAPAAAQQMNRAIASGINNTNPGLRVISPAESLRLLNDSGLADDYARFVEDFTTSGIADSVRLKAIGKGLGADAIFQASLLSLSRVDGRYGRNAGETRITLTAAILETRSGKMVWEASAEGVKGTKTTLGDAPQISEAAKLAVDKIAESIPVLN